MAFLLGFLSHFILDFLPHLDPGTFTNVRIPGIKKVVNLEKVHSQDKPWPRWVYIYAFLEFIFAWALLILIILFKGETDYLVLIAGGFGAIFTDILDNPVFHSILGWPILKQIHWLHHRFHYDLPPNRWYLGLPSEIIIIGGALWFLLKF